MSVVEGDKGLFVMTGPAVDDAADSLVRNDLLVIEEHIGCAAVDVNQDDIADAGIYAVKYDLAGTFRLTGIRI